MGSALSLIITCTLIYDTAARAFDNLQMIKQAVAHGSGVSIMPARIMEEEIAQGRLVPIRIAGLDLYRPVGIVHRRKKRWHRAGQAFLDLLQEPPNAWTPTISQA